MKKEYRNSIIGGIFGGLGGTIILYLIRREFIWAYLITYPIFFALAHLIGHLLRDRRGEKEDQRREMNAQDVEDRGGNVD